MMLGHAFLEGLQPEEICQSPKTSPANSATGSTSRKISQRTRQGEREGARGSDHKKGNQNPQVVIIAHPLEAGSWLPADSPIQAPEGKSVEQLGLR